MPISRLITCNLNTVSSEAYFNSYNSSMVASGTSSVSVAEGA